MHVLLCPHVADRISYLDLSPNLLYHQIAPYSMLAVKRGLTVHVYTINVQGVFLSNKQTYSYMCTLSIILVVVKDFKHQR